ncbi:MAG: MBL fold metallo-hydrolase [Parcubacteria group bacterium]
MTKLTCYGGAGTATGANFLLEIGGKKILVDCGMLQGSKDSSEENSKVFEYHPEDIDMLFITHAHIDHTGLVPKLYKHGFRGRVYSTPETKKISELLLMDAAKINKDKENPIYGFHDVEAVLGLWETMPYHEMKHFSLEDSVELEVDFYDAGHVLGSSMIKFTTPTGSMLFTGDVGNSPSPVLKDTEKVSGLDYILIESVYGDRNHGNKDERDAKFKEIVEESIKRGGTLLIPAFSLERTQIMLYALDNLFESGAIPAVPVFLDSPLGIKVTGIYEDVSKLFNKEATDEMNGGDEIFEFSGLRKTMQARNSRDIVNIKGAKIIIAGSGMSTGGRILSHEKTFLPDPNSTLLLVGYQGAGTLGRELEEGAKKVFIDEEEVVVRAHVENVSGFSAHADSDTLVDFVSTSKDSLKKVFVAMGEPRSSIFLAQRLRDELDVDAVVTEKGKVYELDL